MSTEEPDRPGLFASTQNRILFGLSAVLALVSAGLGALILTTDVSPPPEHLVAGTVQMPPMDKSGTSETAGGGRMPAGEPAVPPGETGAPHAGANGMASNGTAPHGTTPPDEPPPALAQPGDSGGSGTPSPQPETAQSPESTQPQQQAALPVPPPIAPPLPPLARDDVGPLAPAPDPGLVEQSPDGLLPKVGIDGRKPWQVYARPFNANESRPRVAVVLTSLGLSSAATESAIQGLPGAVTLSFQPYADNLQQWIHLARAAGHEVLLNLPLEPLDYPTNDPGPKALFTALEPAENLDRLNWALSRVTGYVGVATHMGSRFTTSQEAVAPVMQVLQQRGLLFLDTRASARSVATNLATERGVPRAINDRFLDAREVSRTTIDARLAEVEKIAREVGASVAVGQPYPVTIERIRAWVQTLDEKGLVLAPVSAVVNLQADR